MVLRLVIDAKKISGSLDKTLVLTPHAQILAVVCAILRAPQSAISAKVTTI